MRVIKNDNMKYTTHLYPKYETEKEEKTNNKIERESGYYIREYF
jgi:hypothetical protein